MDKRIAIIRIKGKVGIKKDIKDTFNLLRLYKKNTCVIISNSPSNIGMIQKLDNYTTWGEIDEETFKNLLKKRGKIARKEQLTEEYIKEKINLSLDQFSKEFINFKKELKDIPGFKPFFRLRPPTKGFEPKGIKKPYSMGGVLGYRKNAINDLIKNMI